MAMRKRTLRRLSPVARKLARLAGEADSIGRRLKNMVEEIQTLEGRSEALRNHSCEEVVNGKNFKEIF